MIPARAKGSLLLPLVAVDRPPRSPLVVRSILLAIFPPTQPLNSQGCPRLRAATAARGSTALLARSAPPPHARAPAIAAPPARPARYRGRLSPRTLANTTCSRGALSPRGYRCGAPVDATRCAWASLPWWRGGGAFGFRPRYALSGVAPPLRPLRSPSGPRSSLFVRTLRAALPACSQGARARWACPAAGPPPLCRAALPFLPRKNCDSGARRGLAPAAPLAPSQRSVAVAPPWPQRAVARVSRSPFGRVRPRPQGPRAPFLPRPRYAGER